MRMLVWMCFSKSLEQKCGQSMVLQETILTTSVVFLLQIEELIARPCPVLSPGFMGAP